MKLNVKDAIVAVEKMNRQNGVPESVYVIEECCELIKELTKDRRGKGDPSAIVDEACDVLTTVFTLLYQYGIDWDTIADKITYKCNRALERFAENNEL